MATISTCNDLDLANWKNYPEVETDSLWLWQNREKGQGHQLEYHGNFVPQVAHQLLARYTKAEEVVLDLFLGAGTTAIEAMRRKRRCVGMELQPRMVAHVERKFSPAQRAGRLACLQGDSAALDSAERIRETLAAWGERHAHLAILHPPYHDIIRFSEDREDLSNAADLEAFLGGLRGCVDTALSVLEPGRFLALVIGDKYHGGEVVPLGFLGMKLLQEAGMQLKGVVVKNIAGNEKGKGRTANLWRYRALRGGFYIFKHEYIFIARKKP